MNSLGQLSIENGRKFENLLQVVDHYSRTPDGLLRALGEVCPVNIESESRVRHGPLRIDESEISVKGELGRYCLFVCVTCSLFFCLLPCDPLFFSGCWASVSQSSSSIALFYFVI